MFIQLIKKTLFVILPIGLLALVFAWGWQTGKAQAESKFVVQAAQQVQTALKYFYNDNSRFPSASEFTSVNVVGSYLNVFPISYPENSACPQNFIYKRLTPAAYELNICLPVNYQSFQKGWNKLSSS